MNLTAWYLAQKLACLEEMEGGKLDVVCAPAESAKDKRFLQSLKKNTTRWQFSGLCCKWVAYSWNMNRQFRPTANRCKKQSLLLKTAPNISFLVDCLNILRQVLATHLPYCYICFLFEPRLFLAFPNVWRSSNFRQEIRELIGACRSCDVRSGVFLIG